MRRTSAALAAAALMLSVLAGCSSKDGPSASDLPSGSDLLRDAAAAMAAVNTVKFEITTDGTVDRLGIKGATGSLTRAGDAQGTAQLDQNGLPVEASFVVKDAKLYIKGPTGGWTTLPLALAATVYDPTAILDPQRGAALVLSGATNAKTLAAEQVNGVDTYKVSATLIGKALSGLVPSISEDVSGTAWIGATDKRLHRISFPVPGSGGGGTVTVTFSDFDAPVSVSAP